MKSTKNDLQKNLQGVRLIKDGKKQYVAVLVNIPQRGGGTTLTLLKKGISMALPHLRTFAPPAIASFLLLVGWELVDDIKKIAKDMMDKKETDENTAKIIKDVLSKKYKSASVAIKKLLAIPFFESLIASFAMQGIAKFDPTGISGKLLDSLSSLTDNTLGKISEAIKTCPECHAVGPVRANAPEYFKNLESFTKHVATHKRGKSS
jgi:hypothetical protein